MKNNCEKLKVAVVIGAIILLTASTVFATGFSSDKATNAIDSITNWIANVFKAIGGVVFLFGAVQAFMGFRNEDPDQKYRGLKTAAAGLGVVAIATGYTTFIK